MVARLDGGSQIFPGFVKITQQDSGVARFELTPGTDSGRISAPSDPICEAASYQLSDETGSWINLVECTCGGRLAQTATLIVLRGRTARLGYLSGRFEKLPGAPILRIFRILGHSAGGANSAQVA
jgi:hypothetical protein